MNNKAEVAKIIGLMAAGYSNTQVTEQTIHVYVSLLQDLPLDLLTKSVEQCMTESEFFPTIAKLREKVIRMTEPDRPSALEAWGIVKTEIDRVGFYHSPEFRDPVIAKAVGCMGWQILCTSENEVADRAHFAKIYDCLVLRAKEEVRMLPSVRQFLQERRLMIESGTVQ